MYICRVKALVTRPYRKEYIPQDSFDRNDLLLVRLYKNDALVIQKYRVEEIVSVELRSGVVLSGLEWVREYDMDGCISRFEFTDCTTRYVTSHLKFIWDK